MFIDFLYNQKRFVEAVSMWIFNEFVLKSKSNFNYQQVFEYFSNTSTKKFPITFVAIMENECVGTVSIFENDLKIQDGLKPWLASLYVKQVYRGQAIGKTLINHVIQFVTECGYDNLYLRTEHASEYYKKLGWEFMYDTLDEKGHETNVFRYKLRNVARPVS